MDQFLPLWSGGLWQMDQPYPARPCFTCASVHRQFNHDGENKQQQVPGVLNIPEGGPEIHSQDLSTEVKLGFATLGGVS